MIIFADYCPTPKLVNGKFRYRQRAKFVKYSCNVGFILFGDRYNNCYHGKWDGPPPRCVRPGCRKVNAPINGMIYPSHIGAVLHFYCKSGFELHGPNVTHCNGSSWSTNMPICLQSNAKPALSCDFEDEDLCGWTHDLNHDFDWKRLKLSTPSGAIGTGPSRDHTLGSKFNPDDPSSIESGYYMYIESSSKNENDTARLISPVYEKTENHTCFKFYYHMYGSTIGSLRVYLKLANDSWDLKPSRAFFEEHGNHGDHWIRSIHWFDHMPDDYQIVIEGVRGNGYVSDIAIDDVSIMMNCNFDDLREQEISTTTEIEEDGTIEYLPDDFYSCEGRCYFNATPVGNYRMCSCDENCYERNECCPDYIDFCLLHASTDSDDEYTSIISSSTIPSTKQIVQETTTSAVPTTTKPSTTPTPSKPSTTTTPDHTTSRKTITTTQETTTTSRKTITTTQQTTTTSRSILNEDTTYRVPETTKLTAVKETTEDDQIDMITDDINIKPAWTATTDISNEIPVYPNDMPPIEDVANFKQNSKEKIVILKYKEPNSYLVYYLVGIGFVVAGLIIVAVRRMRGKKSRRLRSGSHGGSASDVRFLTSDELLDLNLVYE